MAEHEPSVGASDDWYTPPEIFTAIGLTFDLDPCSPGPGHWVPARQIYTKSDDGLTKLWHGLVFMNPPFGGRHGHIPWLAKFFDHGNGVAVVRAYTSSDWWHAHMPRAELIVFPRGKTQFVPSAELRNRLEAEAWLKGRIWRNAPGHGIAIIGMGEEARHALIKSNLGMTWQLLAQRLAAA